MMKRAMVFAVWNSLTVAATGSEPKDDSWKTLEVQWRKAGAATVTAEAILRME